tara:strand:+ start:80 stop:442 length:363 start_codon:yes stop_codon:yes gene_type:complete
MSRVKILVYDPCEYLKIKYEYMTTKEILCSIPIFKQWFNACEVYQDYIEIGDSGCCNLILFDKTILLPYMLTINCEKYVHDLGMYTPPIITDILKYAQDKTLPVDEKRKTKCQEFLNHSN